MILEIRLKNFFSIKDEIVLDFRAGNINTQASQALQTNLIDYEGERILNINTLFKWGKVMHGRSIQFAVAGGEIRDVAKLQRYLIQGASPHFEAFLRGPVSGSLRLF